MNDLDTSSEVLVSCSFCLKNKDEVTILIAGQDDVYICDECVAKSTDELVVCSFCFSEVHRKDVLMSSQGGQHICRKCIKICGRVHKRHMKVLSASVGNQKHE